MTAGTFADLRALVLTGAGEKAFTAGIDLSEIDSGAFTLEAEVGVTIDTLLAREAKL